MKKLYTVSFILVFILSFGQTPISLISANAPYNEDFSGMGTTQTDFLPGWNAINNNNGAQLTMAVTDGSASTGNIYNVGIAGDNDRAFGTLADATTSPVLGAVFQNNTGNTVTKLTILTRMEQWKESGDANVNETIKFSYSLDATSLNTGTWNTVTELDLLEKLTSATANMAVNGNLATNYTNIGKAFSGLNWANGTNLWIKWVDTNEAGLNGIYAIDNFFINITEVLGVKQNEIVGLNMHPNPVSNGTLYITSETNDVKSVSVFDVLGKQVLATKTSNGAIDVSDLKGGSYIIKITENGKTDTKKLIIE